MPVPSSALWALPFAGMLLSIAVLPGIAARLWHSRMDAVTAFWCLTLLVPQAVLHGIGPAIAEAWHAVLIDYLPLLSLLLALYVLGAGVAIEGSRAGTPAGNTVFLAIGTLLAGVLGTIGAATMLILPLLRANAHRGNRAHLAVFFIVLVANAGGGLLPLGPPLYIGFLEGVPFFWPPRMLAGPVACVAVPLLAAFYVIDRRAARADPPCPPRGRLRIRGWPNIALVGVVLGSVLSQVVWHPGSVVLLGQEVGLARLAGIAVCLAAAGLSLLLTNPALRASNDFRWEPMHEVALLFAGLFITIAPVLAMMEAGARGPMGWVFHLTSDAAGTPVPLIYFWASGLLSGFLDNAPTYLVFLQQAGGDTGALAAPPSRTLLALSAGSVLFGGLSYIGNAPNLLVRAIAQHQGVRMPGFGQYVLIAGALLVLPFLAISAIWLW